jgi:AraC-like DNA-binding protein
MSTAIAVFHGAFGRVCLYGMDRTMVPHAHREGHLLFHVSGPPGLVVVDGTAYPLSAGQGVAISPWQAHYYRVLDASAPTLALVLYIRPAWFLDASRSSVGTLRFGRVGVEMGARMARLAHESAASLLDREMRDPLMEDRLCALTQGCFDQSWQWTEQGGAFVGNGAPLSDFRVRNAVKLLRRRLGDTLDLDDVAREVGLSRPHFYKLFRQQVCVTPNIYVNSLRMEQAIERLTASSEAVVDIGLDLGFASQASFSRFFIANGVVPPTTYRRFAHVAPGSPA